MARAAAAMALIFLVGHGAGDRSQPHGCPPDRIAGRFAGLQGEPCDCCRCDECDVSRCDRADCDVRTSSPPPVISWRTWRATLPIFRTRAALDEHTGWRAYLDMVYSLETLTFPLDVSTFLFFYHHELAVLPPPLRAPEQRPTMGCPDAANASAGAAALAALASDDDAEYGGDKLAPETAPGVGLIGALFVSDDARGATAAAAAADGEGDGADAAADARRRKCADERASSPGF